MDVLLGKCCVPTEIGAHNAAAEQGFFQLRGGYFVGEEQWAVATGACIACGCEWGHPAQCHRSQQHVGCVAAQSEPFSNAEGIADLNLLWFP